MKYVYTGSRDDMGPWSLFFMKLGPFGQELFDLLPKVRERHFSEFKPVKKLVVKPKLVTKAKVESGTPKPKA